MFYYNIKIKSDDGEYCLESVDKDIIQREMDIYFAYLYDASPEFIGNIKKFEKKEILSSKTETISLNSLQKYKKKSIESAKKEYVTKQTNDEFTQLANPVVGQFSKEYKMFSADKTEQQDKQPLSNKETVFKPIAQEELVFNNIKSLDSEFTNNNKENKNTVEANSHVSIIDTIKNEIKNKKENKIDLTENNDVINFEDAFKDDIDAMDNEIVLQDESKHVTKATMDNIAEYKSQKAQQNNKNNSELRFQDYALENKSKNEEDAELTFKEDKDETHVYNLSELEIENNNEQKNESEVNTLKIQEEPTVECEKSSDFEIIGLGVDDKKLVEEKIKEEKQNKLNQTIELVQDAIKNLDISSDATFNIDIPDTYSRKLTREEIELAIDKEFEDDEDDNNSKTSTVENSSSSQQAVQIEENSKTKDYQADFQEESQSEASQINSIFSNESPFDNPPESQNIIAPMQYPEAKQALNLDFKTFLSNYNSNGIIDEFLICAYYIKHISGQHSFNMKYINSKLFQATGNIADSSVINGLIEGQFIKVIDVDGIKKYSISSVGEEYFMNNYQR